MRYEPQHKAQNPRAHPDRRPRGRCARRGPTVSAWRTVMAAAGLTPWRVLRPFRRQGGPRPRRDGPGFRRYARTGFNAAAMDGREPAEGLASLHRRLPVAASSRRARLGLSAAGAVGRSGAAQPATRAQPLARASRASTALLATWISGASASSRPNLSALALCWSN